MLLISNAPAGTRDIYTHGITSDQQAGIARSLQELDLPHGLDRAAVPVKLNHLDNRAHFEGLPAGHPPVKAILGIPISHCDERVGALFLVGTEGEPGFTADDERMAAMFAAQAASIISNTRRYEDARQATADMETLMDICPVSVSIFDVRSGQFSYMNQECLRILGNLGLPYDQLDQAFAILKFTRPDGRAFSFEELPGTRALQKGETVTAEEIVVHRPDGTTLTTLVNCAPLFSASGEIVSAIMVSQDLSPLQDQELRRAEFLEMVGEELRTPLISIKGSASALRETVDPTSPTESLQLLRIIDQQADLMRGQINSLIELTQIETGALSVIAKPADVSHLIQQACGEYFGDHSAINVQFDIPERLEAVLADQQHITKVLHNLLRHAAVHSSESSPITVSAAARDIYVTISVSVADSSVQPEKTSFPVNAADHPQLFANAALAYNQRAEWASRGEGLAMAYCRGVVEAHGGRISTEADEQQRTLTLTFTLPTVDDDAEIQAPIAANSSVNALPQSDEQTQILVSIPDARLLNTVRQVLQESGYGAMATSALDELEELASAEGPALIVLDIAGREEASFRALRGAGNPLNLPAIVLCERDDEEYVVRAFEMGADGYMVKPFSPTELIARIKATLRRLSAGGDISTGRAFEAGDLKINFENRTVSVSGEQVPFTSTEYRLLTELANGAGRVFTQDMLLQRVWGPEYSGESQLLRSYIKSLRQKLGDNARKPTYIFTEHGIGYRMARPERANVR